jgi:GTP-binding nuclear protein Ran
MASTYKLVLVGDMGVGKTAYVKSLLTGEFDDSYVTSPSVEIHPIRIDTNRGGITFNVWDTAGTYAGVSKGYFIRADCAIVMYDRTNEISKKNIPTHIARVRESAGDIPIVVVGNKMDAGGKFHMYLGIEKSTCISVKTGHNKYAPFSLLAEKLRDDKDLYITQDDFNGFVVMPH